MRADLRSKVENEHGLELVMYFRHVERGAESMEEDGEKLEEVKMA